MTSNPRRYLVRPNKGWISPSGVEEISIILVDNEKQDLLQRCDQFGPAGLDDCKDQFQIEYCFVEPAFVDSYLTAVRAKEDFASVGESDSLAGDIPALNRMWQSITADTKYVRHSKLLHARHLSTHSPSEVSPVTITTNRAEEMVASLSTGLTASLTASLAASLAPSVAASIDTSLAASIAATVAANFVANHNAQDSRLIQDVAELKEQNSDLRRQAADLHEQIAVLRRQMSILESRLPGVRRSQPSMESQADGESAEFIM